MIHRKIVFRLPLVNHFVQQGVFDFKPSVTLDMMAADCYSQRPVGLQVECYFTQFLLHSPRYPEADVSQRTIEESIVQRSVKLR